MYFVDVNKLNRKIAENGITKETIATAIGISLNVLSQRLKSRKFLIGEMHKICDVLHLSGPEAIEIFLAQYNS